MYQKIKKGIDKTVKKQTQGKKIAAKIFFGNITPPPSLIGKFNLPLLYTVLTALSRGFKNFLGNFFYPLAILKRMCYNIVNVIYLNAERRLYH